MPSFMAKPSANLPGCGGHIHVNLIDKKTKTNVFYDESDANSMVIIVNIIVNISK